MSKSKHVVACISAAALMSLAVQANATSCNTRTFSGDWQGEAYGVSCDLRSVASGNIRGVCLKEYYDEERREFFLEPIDFDGRFNILSDCFIDGNIRLDRQETTLIVGRAWANQGNVPDEAYVMPSNNQSVSLF